MQTDKTKKKFGDFPDQRVKIKEKEKEEWYIASINYVIDRAIGANNKSETLDNLNMANGIIDNKTINYAINPYIKDKEELKKQLRFPNTIRDIDIITPIKERYLGEFIKQYHNYQVYIHDSDSVFLRNTELADAIKSVLLQKLQELILKEEEDGNVEDLDIEQFSKDFITEWTDERVIKGQQRLNLINDLTQATVKYIQAFFYWFATEEVYSYRCINNNDLEKVIVAPWEYYRVNSGNMFVEDDDMGMRRYKMSVAQIIDKFRDELPKKDLDYIREVLDRNTDSASVVPTSLLHSRKAVHMYMSSGSIPMDGTLSFADNSRMVDVYHAVWKTETLIYLLKYIDFNTGEIKETYVPQDYEIDEAAGDISIEEEWISEVYEGYRFGGKYEGVYLPATPIDVQRQEVNNISVCKLPYNGVTGLLHDNHINPIPKRLAVYQLLLKLYHLQREKAIAKFKAFNLIPESILLDSAEMTLEERLAYASADDLLPFNDENIDPSVTQAIKTLYNQGAERYIGILSEVIESLKREAMDTANMNEQRYGDIGQQAGKSVTEYAITKATTGSILMFEIFNKFRERDYMADLDYSKAAWVDGKKGSYIDPNTKDIVYVDIDGINELGTNIGVFIKNSALEEEKLKMYRELAFAASQGGKYGMAADAIDSENSTELRRLIKKAEEADKEYQKEIETAKEKLQLQIQQGQQQKDLEDRLHEKEIVQMKEDAATNRKLAELEVKIQELQIKYSTEAISSDVPDEYKQQMEEANLELKRQKQSLDELKAMAEEKEPVQ